MKGYYGCQRQGGGENHKSDILGLRPNKFEQIVLPSSEREREI